jgi:4-hydroxy-4-methyl-2-oxoglutarate aldolase
MNENTKAPAVLVTEPKTMPPATELSQRYLKLHGGDINQALDSLKEETQMLDLRIKPLVRGMKVAGLAVTWNAVLASQDPIPESASFFKSRFKIYDHIRPGSVFVYQPGGEMSSGHLGNMYGNMIAARGATGAVVDGNLRDSDGHLTIPNWAPFSRGTSPLEAGSRIKWMDCNTRILMSGELSRWIEVFPGDLVFGDGDGVIVIPKRLILPVLEMAESTYHKEILAEKEYASGADPEKVMAKYGAA